MRFQLNPLVPNGVSIAPERPINRARGAVLAGKDGKVQSIVAGTNVTVDNADPRNPIVSSSGGGSGSGITRSVSNISTNTNAGSASTTDYTYIVTGVVTLTLPTAVGNTNRYSVISTDGQTTIATTSAQTINGSSTVTLPITNMSLDFVSDNTNWHVE